MNLTFVFNYTIAGKMSLFVILLIIAFISCANESPANTTFHVVDSESSFVGKPESPLLRFHLVEEKDIVTLRDGYLLLMNSMGEFFEFSGDTTILVNDLIANQNYVDAPKYRELNIRSLFGKAPIYLRGATAGMGCTSGIDIIFNVLPGYDNKFELPFGEKHCLWWGHMGKLPTVEKYKITIRNLYDEVIDEIWTNNRMIELELDQYKAKGDLYVLQVIVDDGKEPSEACTSKQIAFILKENPTCFIPNACGEMIAVKALEIACHVEMNGNIKLAGDYYRTAVSLSEHKEVYREIYNWYHKRNKILLESK